MLDKNVIADYQDYQSCRITFLIFDLVAVPGRLVRGREILPTQRSGVSMRHDELHQRYRRQIPREQSSYESFVSTDLAYHSAISQ